MQNTDEKAKFVAHKLKKISVIAVCVALVICTLFITFGNSLGIPSWNNIFAFCGVSADLGDNLSLSFVNVGSADACFIKCGDKNILIDAGTSLSADKLSTYLRRNGCTHFDAVILSHPDSDHIGGIASIIENFGTDIIYMSRIPDDIIPETAEYKGLLSSVKENKIDVCYPEIPSTIMIGDMSFTFISPNGEYSSTNDNSLVVRLQYKNVSALFTGDISNEVEADLINSDTELKSDILKVAHHGSKTSSSDDFLKAVSPNISVVSVGSSDNSLPDYNTMARISHYSDFLYRTDKDGVVVITSDGNNLEVQTHA